MESFWQQSPSPLFLRSLTRAKAFLLTLARAIEYWSWCFELKTSQNSETSIWKALAALHLSARTQDQNLNHRFSFGILEMKMIPDCVLPPVLFPPLTALPAHQAQTIGFLVPCSTHLLPVRNRRLGSFSGWPCWSKIVSGAHAFFCAQWSEGYIPCGTNVADNKMGRTRSCSLAAVTTSGYMLYKQ